MEIRPVSTTDRTSLDAFFVQIPERDRTFFREDVSDPQVVAGWTQPSSREERAVAVEGDGTIVGWLALVGGVGWSSHVGHLAVIVAPSDRRRGLGRALAQHGVLTGLRHGYSKIVVEIVADEDGAIQLFEDLGFVPEALLVDHVRDRRGDLRDLIVLAHHAQDVSGDLAAIGLSEELGS